MNPIQLFFILLIVVPIIEIYLLIQVGSAIGAMPTILLIIITAVLGAFLFRLQGLSTWQRVQTALANHEIPAIEMIEGIMLLVCGALLLTPGFFTDVIGFLCLIPAVRRYWALYLLQRHLAPGGQPPFDSGANPGFDDRSSNRFEEDDVIEGEFKRDDEPSDQDRLP